MRVELDTRPDILGVLVDGKVIPGAVAFDLEEGYVEQVYPKVPGLADKDDGTFEVDEAEVVWETRQLRGKIQLAIARKK